jgi:hypothetical protein
VIEYICKKLLKFFDYISEDITALEIAECISRWSTMSYGGNIEAILIVLGCLLVTMCWVWRSLAQLDSAKCHDDRLRHLSNIKVITSTIWKTPVLVLLMRGIYEERILDGHSRHDIPVHTKYHDDWFKHLNKFAITITTIWDAAVFVFLMGGIYDVWC